MSVPFQAIECYMTSVIPLHGKYLLTLNQGCHLCDVEKRDGGTKRQRRFNRDAKGVEASRLEGGGEIGRGYPPPHPTRGSGGAYDAPPVGSGAKPRKIMISRLFSVSKTQCLCC